MELLKVKDLCKSYGKGEIKVDALKSINLTINQGEFVAIVGPSGSGKSTLLHLLGGVDRPSSGKIILEGTDIYSLKENELAILRRRKIGFIFQFYNLIPVLTAEENIEMPVLLDNKNQTKIYGRAFRYIRIKRKKKSFTCTVIWWATTKGFYR